MFTIYKNGEVWDHVIVNTMSADVALNAYCKVNMIENHGEFTCDRGEREEELARFDATKIAVKRLIKD